MIDLLPAAPAIPKIEAAPGPQAPDSTPRPEPQHAQSTPDRAAEPAPALPQQEAAVAIPEPPPAPQIQGDPSREEPNKHSEQRTLASRSATPPTFESQHKATARAKAAGAASISSAAIASWKGELMAQLNRHKRYPPGAERDGTSLVAFNVNRSGAVTTARLVRSSGDTTLDQEAVSLPRRASPLPAPPDGMSGSSIALTVPIHFER